MSYIVLARKWRPQNFEDLIGQENVAQTFKNAILQDRIVHAYLFSGPRGIGKTSTARILSKALNCTDRIEGEPCGKCESCKAITSGASVDVFEIDGASNTGVDDVRDLRDGIKYAPSSGKYKIYIIDEVHMLSTQAFNALLKTLEEPPPHVIFIFATTEAKKIPATILSRCQHHLFRKIPKERIKTQLKNIVEAEKINIQETPLDMIARAADGSMRDALTLLDQAASFSSDVSEKDLQMLLGLPEMDVISGLSEAILDGDINGTLSIVKDQTDRGYDLRSLTKELLEHFRNLAIVKVTENAENFLDFSEDEVKDLRKQSEKVGIEPLTLILTELLRLDGEVKSAMNPRYTLELGLLRMSFVKGMTSVDAVIRMLNETPGSQDTATGRNKEIKTESIPEKKSIKTEDPHPENKIQPHDKAAASSHETTYHDKEELWNKVVEHFDAEDHTLACKLAEARAVDLTAKELVIGFNGGMSLLADSIKKNSSSIEEILKKLAGKKLKLSIVPLAAKKSENKNSITKENIISEPLVQDAMKIFNSTILEVKSLEVVGSDEI
ncbi:MAG: DNA polymerase III subunit gamma/tau [Thermodesulfovibrionia bacterium]|nr:DNA polymerase III subunit gamma/tau [Thermodesulfovibrionia bacterium]